MASVIDIATTAADRPPALDDRALFGHPRGLGLLFITEMWERFSYYGMRAILVLYLVNFLRWDTPRATNLYGTYTMLVYLTPLVGGYLADRIIGTRRSLVIGGFVIAAGHFALAFHGMTMFYIGLGLIIIGTGFFKPNVSTMVGQIYTEGDPRRDSGFTIFYMGINLGAFLGPFICGWLAQKSGLGWHAGFAAAGVGMVIGLIIYITFRDKYLPGIGLRPQQDPPSPDRPATMGTADSGSIRNGLLGAVVGGIVGWFAGDASILGLAMGATIGAALAITLIGSQGEERKRVIALFIVSFFVVFFWAAYEQTGSSMNLFADKHTDLQVGSYSIPSSWFQSVNPAYILIFAPVFAWVWTRLEKFGREPSTALKMVLGLALLGTGFVFMVIGGYRADTGILVSPLWLLLAYLFHTWGELCLSPVGLSYVTKVAPWQFASLLMGVWFLANGAANKLAGFVAGFVATIPSLGRFYSIFVVSSFAAALLMLLLVPWLKRLTRTVKA